MDSELIHSTSKIRSHLFNVQCHSKCVSTFVMVAIRPPLHRELPVVFSSRNTERLNSTSGCSTCSLASCVYERELFLYGTALDNPSYILSCPVLLVVPVIILFGSSLSHGSAARKTVIFRRRYVNAFSGTTSIWHWESRPITENLSLLTSNKRLFCNAANVMPVLH